MKVAVFGQTGQVATELQRRAPGGVTLEVIGRDRADFAVPDLVFETASATGADAFVNAVAYTQVDKAESEPNLANAVNGVSVGALGEAAAKAGTPLVHISTDYVFDGAGDESRNPDEPTHPLGQYGRSKLLGETLIAKSECRAAVLRTSWVFSSHGSNFVKTMLRLGVERDTLSIVSDQIGGPTPASAIADACFRTAAGLVDGHAGGIYHLAGTPDTSWADFAREIFRQAGIDCAVTDIPTSDYPTPAQRPLNSRLDCSSLEADFGIARPDWKAGLADVLKELST